MTKAGALQVTTPSDREIAMTRVFNAPRALVYEAMTKPELIRRWMGVMPGWTMPVCEVDLRVGGAYRYLWRHEEGHEMGMAGVYLEIVVPGRLAMTEKFDESWYPGAAVETVVLTEQGGVTTLVSTVRYDTQAARDEVLRSPMEEGVASSYDHLEELLATSSR